MKTTLAESNLPSNPLQTALSLLSKEKMRETLRELCSDKYGGRRMGTPSHDLVTDWIAKRFLDLGLGMRTNSFYTEDEFLDLYSRPSLVELNDEGKVVKEFEHRVEFAEHPRSKELKHFSEGVVAIWSEQTDSSNKWLIFDSRNGPDLYQFSKVVASLGASGVIISQSADKNGFFWKQLPAPSAVDVPVFFVRAEIVPHLVGKKVRAILPLRRNRVRGVNVIGELSGSDSSLKNSPLIVSAHYDAVGDDPSGHRFQGAGDNAAGLAVILELARILASSKVIPRRTVQFVAFDGEEANASGSRAYAKFIDCSLIPKESF
jgi:aminopeptidase YwaD